jgi:hypothetical protein
MTTDASFERLRLLDPLVARVAGWPVETIEPFGDAELAALAASVAEAADVVSANRETALAALGARHAVTDPDQRILRRRMRRRIAEGDDPFLTPGDVLPADLDARERDALASEQSARLRLARRRAELLRRHTTVLDAEREALRVIAASSAFERGLALRAPELLVRLASLPPPAEVSRARHRRLETTLLLYVLRAVGRTTPQGAWCGTVPVERREDAPGATATATTGAVRAGVDLRTIAVLLAALRADPRYRRELPLRLNPTLRRDDDGYRYVSADGVARRLDRHPFVDAVVAHLDGERGEQVAPLLDALAAAGADPARLRALLDDGVGALVARDVLRVCLDLPVHAADGRDAVTEVIGRLLEPERTRWTAAWARVSATLDELESRFEHLDGAAVAERNRRVRDELVALWQAAELPGGPPAVVVHVDWRPPWTLTLGPDVLARLGHAARTLFAVHAADGAAERYRRWCVEDLLGPHLRGDGTGPDAQAGTAGEIALTELLEDGSLAGSASPWLPVTRREVFGRFVPSPERRAAVEADLTAWERRLAPDAAAARHDLDDLLGHGPTGVSPGPAGELFLHLDGEGVVWCGAARPQPGLATTRLGQLVGSGPSLARALAEVAPPGTEVADVVGADPVDPATALRPALLPTVVDGAGRCGPRVADLEVQVDPRELRPWLCTSDGRRLLPVYPSAAAIGRVDPASRVLLALALGQGWELVSYRFPPLDQEVTAWQHRPRLTAAGVVVAPERWTLPPDTVEELARRTGADRFARWSTEMRARQVPRLVRAAWSPHHSDLLVVTDSPLVVEALFARVAVDETVFPLTLEELPGDPATWPVVDEHGGHHLVQLAATWLDPGWWDDTAEAET